MLFKVNILRQIKEGKVTVAFRIWKKPTVKAGGNLITPVGQLQIDRLVTLDSNAEITDSLAEQTGFSKQELIHTLQGSEGKLYKIEFHLIGEDPRIALRQKPMTELEIELILKKLKRIDSGPRGPWTKDVLRVINDNPKVSAKNLAEILKVEKDWLKIQIRKLKNMGLTISHEVGYSIAPRGKTLKRFFNNS